MLLVIKWQNISKYRKTGHYNPHQNSNKKLTKSTLLLTMTNVIFSFGKDQKQEFDLNLSDHGQ